MAILRWNVFFILGGLLLYFPAASSSHEARPLISSCAFLAPHLCIIRCFTALFLPACRRKWLVNARLDNRELNRKLVTRARSSVFTVRL